MGIADQIKFDDRGLVPAVAQDAETGDVLMVAWMNRESFLKTLETGRAHYWSRSRKELWEKGATSGNTQEVHSVSIDCDGDTLLLKITQKGGAACHEGYRSCFFREIQDDSLHITSERVFDPKDVYGKQ